MKNRIQGEAPRIESCPKGGEHVLMRPVQIYCDRCRPKKRQQTLDRQRHWRERQRAVKHGGVAPTVAAAADLDVTVSAPFPAEQRIADLVRELGVLTARLVADYESPERGMAPDVVDRAVELNALVAQVHVAARRLRPGSTPADELAARRVRTSG